MKNAHGERMFVLIIENGIGKMESVHKSLQKADCQHGFANNREDAIKILKTTLYDFVIMDYAMPGMTGEEFQKAIQVNDSKATIIFTFSKIGISPEINIKDCKWLGLPFQNGELLNLIQSGAQHNGL
jgi:CheY-like chemotaxis protein